MSASRLQSLAESVHGEALVSSGEILALLQTAFVAIDEAVQIADERERRERAGPENGAESAIPWK